MQTLQSSYKMLFHTYSCSNKNLNEWYLFNYWIDCWNNHLTQPSFIVFENIFQFMLYWSKIKAKLSYSIRVISKTYEAISMAEITLSCSLWHSPLSNVEKKLNLCHEINRSILTSQLWYYTCFNEKTQG